MKSKSYGFLLFVLALGALSAYLFTVAKFKLGLDVKGGVRLDYQVIPQKQAAGTSPAPGSPAANTPQSMQFASGSSNEAVLAKTQKILENRVSSVTGVTEGSVVIKQPDQVVVELPGFADIETAKKQIGSSASLKIYWAKNVVSDNPAGQYMPYVPDPTSENGNPVVYFTNKNNPGEPEIKPTLPNGDPNPEYQNIINGWQLLLNGDQLTNATGRPMGNGDFEPEISFTDKGGQILQQWSEQYRGQGQMVAMVLDGRVLQIAPVKKDGLLGQQISIEGSFSPESVKALTDLLNAGALPADLKLVSSEKIDPTIGNAALGKMVSAGVIAFGVISLFLIVYYAFPGFVAFIALMLYVLFTLTMLKLINATFSLAAIAGFVLSVGMAVDANILVFERFKEEIKKNRTLHEALGLGFKRAFPAILDSNICSIITCLVLFYFGEGPVKGFATTLLIGVVISLFTAVTVTRSLLFFLVDSGIGNNLKFYALNRNWFGEHLESKADSKPLDIVGNTRLWFSITSVFIVISFIFIVFLHGIRPNVEFLGGLEVTYARQANSPTPQQMTASLQKAGLTGCNVTFASSSDQGKTTDLVYITVPGQQLAKVPDNLRASTIATDAGLGNAQALDISEVSPTIQKEVTLNAVLGIICSFALIIVWLGIRFGFALGSFRNGLRFGGSAIIAGTKDVWVVFGLAGVVGYFAGWEISSLFITALLTVIGFTVHDKIVIFDRVRENLMRYTSGESIENLINRSVTQTIARSINTATAVVLTLAILYFFGSSTPDLKFFILTMLIGIAWGTYSSIFTAAPVLNLWEKKVREWQGEDKTLIASVMKERTHGGVNPGVVVIPKTPTPAASSQPSDAPASPAATQRSYGTVRRRASAVPKKKDDLDDL